MSLNGRELDGFKGQVQNFKIFHIPPLLTSQTDTRIILSYILVYLILVVDCMFAIGVFAA